MLDIHLSHIYNQSIVRVLYFIFSLTLYPVAAFAQSPAMGWNSYNAFGLDVKEQEVMANADYMSANLKDFGWQYIVIDMAWYKPGGDAGRRALPAGMQYNMDTFGRLMPAIDMFPSATDGKGFTALANYIHSLGLKFGIHLMRGIPRQAVLAKTPVPGVEGITADMIADTSSTCKWSDIMWGLDMSKKGSQEYLNSIFSLYASWGVDFVKVDDISSPYHEAEIEGYRAAINASGRKMHFSLSPGPAPVEKYGHLREYADQWRITGDRWDIWYHIYEMFGITKQWQGKAKRGAYPDCDMLVIGNLALRGHTDSQHFSRLTTDELYTHITLWSIVKSPLFIGCNMPDNRDIDLKLLTNKDVIAVNQKGRDPRRIMNNDNAVMWISVMPDSSWNVALFNTGDTAKKVGFHTRHLGFSNTDKTVVRDIWTGEIISRSVTPYRQYIIPPHGTRFLRVSKAR